MRLGDEQVNLSKDSGGVDVDPARPVRSSLGAWSQMNCTGSLLISSLSRRSSETSYCLSPAGVESGRNLRPNTNPKRRTFETFES